MDRVQVYRAQEPFETDVLRMQQFAFEGQGLLALDIMGSSTLVGGFTCAATAPASLSVNVAPGRVYTKTVLDNTAIGQFGGAGGLNADTNSDHAIMKQGLLRDTTLLTFTPPGTAGQSQCFLIQTQLQETDDAGVSTAFYNSANPASPNNFSVSPNRRNAAVLGVKAGIAATTGSQTAPSADAGWTPLWVITVANGQTQITAGSIAAASGAPFISTLASLGTSAATAAMIWAGSDATHFITAAAMKASMVPQTLTYGSTAAWDMTAGFNASVTLAGNPTIANPTGLMQGSTIVLEVIQDATGTRVPSWGSAYDWGSNGAPTLSTAAGKKDYFIGYVADAVTPKIKMTFWKSA